MNGNRGDGREVGGTGTPGGGVRPSWTDALRPDPLARARMRRAIRAAAGPLLRARRLSWWEVASDWASLLTPAAAAAAILFVAVALRDPAPPAPEAALAGSARLEDLMVWESSEALPAALTSDSLADLAVVFAAIHERR
jgi:hypothetical protein